MGAWGPKLYEDDVADDVKMYYMDQLRKGQTNIEVTNNMLNEFKDYIEDSDDGPIFWFALADTQWKIGRLLPFVKEKALEYLETNSDHSRWENSDIKVYETRKKLLEELKKQLLSPMPSEKKIRKYRLFKCEWQIGDVFAYQFTSEHSKKYGLYKKYILFRKVEETIYWPGHIIPVLHIYNWFGTDIPNVDIIENLPCLPQDILTPYSYQRKIITESKKEIPNDKLNFLGNIKKVMYPLKGKILKDVEIVAFDWKDFDKFFNTLLYSYEYKGIRLILQNNKFIEDKDC